MHECILYEKLEGDKKRDDKDSKKKAEKDKVDEKKVKCTACRHYCKILPGKTGICGVRKNKDGKLYLLAYGKAAGVNIDPIEKKPLYHFLPGTDIIPNC